MKKLIIALGLGLTIAMFNTSSIEAQHVSVNINLDIQPAWGPSGYHYADFYYIPELNIYYDVNHGLFVYLSGRRWVSNIYLPKKYHKYDFYLMHKVVLNDIYNPWVHNKYHKRSYAHFRNNRSQIAIYYMNDRHYHKARHNHWAWVEPRYMPKQKHNSHKHLAHQHQPVHVNKNSSSQYRSSANNTRANSRNQVNNSNRNTKQNNQSVANANRSESRSSSTRSSGNNTSSASKRSEANKNENKQAQSTESRSNKRNESATTNNSNRTETRSASNRRSEAKASSATRSESRSSQKSESKSRSSSSRSGSTRSNSR